MMSMHEIHVITTRWRIDIMHNYVRDVCVLRDTHAHSIIHAIIHTHNARDSHVHTGTQTHGKCNT